MATLNPIILEKLAAFHQRWRRLIKQRGLCEGLVCLLASLTLVALIDRFFVLPDSVRVGMSVAAWVITFLVEWFGCVRFLVKDPGPRELALRLEQKRPDLREQLLSAVELGESSEAETSWDSPVFRELIQENVSERMRGVNIDQVLPRRLISRWLLGAAITIFLFALLFLVPGLSFHTLIARALAPTANIERVSNLKIKLVEPAAEDLQVPYGDSVSIVVDIQGGEPAKVELQAYYRGERTDSAALMMNRVSDTQYSAAIPATSEQIEYRVRAGTALTRLFHIETQPRPQVLSFSKSFKFPEYTALPDKSVTEEQGDLKALFGTLARVRFQTDQPIREAALILEEAGKETRQEVSRVSDQEFEVSLPVVKSMTYRVQLVAEKTGFENKFSPYYEITPVPDQVPRVVMEEPANDLVVQADDVLKIAGWADDELGVTNVICRVRMGVAPMDEVTLFSGRSLKADVSFSLDMLSIKAAAGDNLTIVLAAHDLRGSEGTSKPIHVQVSTRGFDLSRVQALDAKRALHVSLEALRKEAEDLKELVQGDPLAKQAKGSEEERKQAHVTASARATAVGQRLDFAWKQVTDTMGTVKPGRDSDDLALVAQALSQMRHERLADVHEAIERLQFADSPDGKDPVNTSKDATRRLADAAKRLEQQFENLVAAESAAAVVDNLGYLATEQRRMNDQAESESNSRDPLAWQRLARRQLGSTREIEALEGMIDSLAKELDSNKAKRTEKPLEHLKSNREALSAMLQKEASPELERPSKAMNSGVRNALSGFVPLARDLEKDGERARNDLRKDLRPAFAAVEELRKSNEQLASTERKLAEARAKDRPDPGAEKRAGEQRAEASHDWEAAIGQLRDRADIEEKRPDSDRQFVQDLNRTSRALRNLRTVSGGDNQATQATESLKALEQAMRTLEPAHELAGLNRNLKELVGKERWESNTAEASTDHPQQWGWLGERLKRTGDDLKRAGLPGEIADPVQQAANGSDASTISREMQERQAAVENPNWDRATQSMAGALDSVASATERARSDLAPKVAQARETLDREAPSMSELMKGLARAAESMERETRAAGQASGENPASALYTRQKDLGEQVGELRTDLRRDANVQDIATSGGRDRARDADDAVAMLTEPPAKAEAALREAATTSKPQLRGKAMDLAVEQQGELAKRLNQLAEHYGNLEKGAAEESRADLRQMEEQLGIKSGLDAAYQQAEALAAMNNKTPQEILADLEKELATDSRMREELGNIADKDLDTARANLQFAADKEREISGNLGELDKNKPDTNALAKRVGELADQARKMAERDISELGMSAASAKVDANEAITRAGEQFNAAAEHAPKDFNQPAEHVAEGIRAMAEQLQGAREGLVSAANQAGEAKREAPAGGSQSAAAHMAQKQASQAASQAGQMATELQRMAEQLAQSAGQAQNQMSEGEHQQSLIGQQVAQSGADIARAGRHESRLGTEQGLELQRIGDGTQSIAQNEVVKAREKLKEAGQTQEARQAVDQAAKSVESQLASLNEALKMAGATKSASSGSAQPGQTPEPGKAGEPATPGQPGEAGQAGQPGEAAQAGQPGEAGQPGSQGQPGEAGQSGQGQMAQAGQPGAQGQPGEGQAGQGGTPADSKWKARTLDRLDASLNPAQMPGMASGQEGQGQPGQGQQGQQGQPGQQGQGQPGQGQSQGQGQGNPSAQQVAQEAMQRAAEAMQNAMAQARQEGGTPGQQQGQPGGPGQPGKPGPDGTGAGAMLTETPLEGEYGELIPLSLIEGGGNWAKLPPKLAQGLMEARSESMEGDYRAMVETYFKVIAEKAGK